MHLLKSFDERGREVKREEEGLGQGLPVIILTEPPTPTPPHPGAGTGSQRGKETEATEKKGKLSIMF